jgi:hypothetical protein
MKLRTPLFLVSLLLISTSMILAGCGKGAVACAVVDAAHQACTVVKYMGPDGKVREVRVSQEELASFGQRTEAARAREGKDPKTGEAKPAEEPVEESEE